LEIFNEQRAFEYGRKAELLVNADLGKPGLSDGFSTTIHAEYNFEKSVNGYGGTIALVNTALCFPGMEGAGAFDLSRFRTATPTGSTGWLLRAWAAQACFLAGARTIGVLGTTTLPRVPISKDAFELILYIRDEQFESF
jgi:hypothetical protein